MTERDELVFWSHYQSIWKHHNDVQESHSHAVERETLDMAKGIPITNMVSMTLDYPCSDPDMTIRVFKNIPLGCILLRVTI